MRQRLRAKCRLAALITAALAVASSAAATPAEDAYIAARDAAIAKVKAATDAEPANPTGGDDEKVIALDNRELADLEKLMRVIVEPVAIKGLDGESAINLDTLFQHDEGFGLLDGMVYGKVDARTRVIVTTDGLFRHWLQEHKDWWDKDSAPLPQEPSAVVRDNDFYTQAVMTDAAIVRFADLPIHQPANTDFAYAMLASRTQDEVPAEADEIFIALEHGGRVFIAYTKDFRPIGPIAACNAIRRDFIKKAAETAQKPGPDQDPDALSAEADVQFLRCFAAAAPQQRGFAAAVKAAQTLLDDLPLR
ncbi:MAG TPA: hypothetical protein VL048_21315 [Xanthobacteraceae bacterium]|nr:hypothetical protein [Xanthobacteraceae bacterium]